MKTKIICLLLVALTFSNSHHYRDIFNEEYSLHYLLFTIIILGAVFYFEENMKWKFLCIFLVGLMVIFDPYLTVFDFVTSEESWQKLYDSESGAFVRWNRNDTIYHYQWNLIKWCFLVMVFLLIATFSEATYSKERTQIKTDTEKQPENGEIL